MTSRSPAVWDAHFMSIARLNADMSTCVKRHVGACAVRGKRVLAAGFNGNLPGAVHCDEGGCDRCNDPKWVSGVGLERCVCVHAEQNLVAWCARYGISLDGASIYTTTYPCSDCMKLVVSAGIVEIVYDEPYTESLYEMYNNDADPIIRRIAA